MSNSSSSSEAWPNLRQRIADLVASGRTDAIEAVLSEYPDLRSHEQLLVDCIYGEFCFREERNQTPQPTEYLYRFPEYARQLQALFEVHAPLELLCQFSGTAGLTQQSAEIPPEVGATIPWTSVCSGSAGDGANLPTHFGRYQIETLLGRGAFGEVYKAWDARLRRPVAIKLTFQRFLSSNGEEAYLTEARTVANLDHPHIVPVYDVGQTDNGDYYLVSKLIEGSDLAGRMKGQRLSVRESVTTVASIADALHHAHATGLVHRDVKPGNILIDMQGRAFLTDFGIAMREEDFGRDKEFAGTPGYMSPEQARGEGHRIDGRSDLYSLGVVLYALLTGRRPFECSNTVNLQRSIAEYEVRPPRQLDQSISRELERICLKALALRVSDRYSTGSDFAADLRLFAEQDFSRQIPVKQSRSNPQETEQPVAVQHQDATPATDSPAEPPVTPTGPTRVVPRGLRSFDQSDADFFLELLPGPVDRMGLPDRIRFWKRKIEAQDAEESFSVGLIYGPSGCGKSSLMKAGVIPWLADNVIPIYVEATGSDTERQLLRAIQRRLQSTPLAPGEEIATGKLTGQNSDRLSDVASRASISRSEMSTMNGRGLKETLTAIRRGQGLPRGKTLLLVIDQFEQWLHARDDYRSTELIAALRQCDGIQVRCIVMVRDDFWLSVSRFMGELEIGISPSNSRLVDLFDIDHATRVLGLFGRAYEKLPESSLKWTKDQHEFVQQAVAGLAQERRVVSVRLALFAEMMKSRDWTTAALKEVGGTEGVGTTFLEETFSSRSAPPQYRDHQTAARAVLAALLPTADTDIKGHMRSQQELAKAAGDSMYSPRSAVRASPSNSEVEGTSSRRSVISTISPDFADLVRILDSELRLITPTDSEDRQAGERQGVSPPSPSLISPPTPFHTQYYQLTHDYLVPSLRDWLTRKQKETRRGRAELKLAERSALWNARPESRHLPSPWEWLTIRTLTESKKWTSAERTLMRRAGRVHLRRWGSGLALSLILAFGIRHLLSQRQMASMRQQIVTAVEAAQHVRGAAVPFVIQNLHEKFPRDLVTAELKNRFGKEMDSHRKLGLAIPLADFGTVDSEFLVSQVDNLSLEDTDNLYTALVADREQSLTTIRGAAIACDTEKAWRRKARLAVLGLHLGEDKIAHDMAAFENRPDPVQRTILIDEFSKWSGSVAHLTTMMQLCTDPGLRSAVCLAVGSIPESRLSSADKQAWQLLASQWYRSVPDTSTHSASAWLLRKLGSELPELPRGPEPAEGKNWYINSLGMEFLKIPTGRFHQLPESNMEHQDREVQITEPFWLSDREVSVGPFQQFIKDTQYRETEKSGTWHDRDQLGGPKSDLPVIASWYGAVEYCNWLSLNEGFSPCYERTGEKEKVGYGETECDAWRLIDGSNGYRLPHEIEWEYACRADTATEFSSGNDEELLHSYAQYSASRAVICGSKLPNAWGLCDMHGNVWEWCCDRFDKTDAMRALRGGSLLTHSSFLRSAVRNNSWPDLCNSGYGFRVARTLPHVSLTASPSAQDGSKFKN